MATPKGINNKSQYKDLNDRLEKVIQSVRSLYNELNKEVASYVSKVGYDGEKEFHWKDYPQLKKKVLETQKKLSSNLKAIVMSGTSEEWKKSNLVQDLLADKVLSSYGVEHRGEKYNVYYQTNSDALKAFQQRKISKGGTISQNIWNQSQNYRQELEYAISTAIQKGTDAVTLSKQISKYLTDFDKLSQDYTEKFGKAVKCKDCEYRSIRLARSEINIAYRTAEQTRWEQMDFVVGYEIKLSHQHHHRMPKGDICDTLAGKYPKNFKWNGWHPNDMCYVVPILKSEEEFWSIDENEKEIKYNGLEKFKEWVVNNRSRIRQAESRGTLPYFLADNNDIYKNSMSIQELSLFRHSKRDDEAIKNRWDNRKKLIEDDSYRDYLNSYKYAETLGVDFGSVDDYLGGVSFEIDEYDNIMSQIRTEILKEYSLYKQYKDELKQMYDLLHSPFGNYGVKKIKREVDSFYSSLPDIPKLKYPYKINIPKLKLFNEKYKGLIEQEVEKRKAKNVLLVEKKLGIKKGGDMSFDEADKGMPNINYGKGEEYSVNCQCCVVAYELRRRGYSVTAVGRKKGYTPGPDRLAHNTATVWSDIYTGGVPEKLQVLNNDANWVSLKVKLENSMKENGRYHVNFSWANQNYGHIIVVEKQGDSFLWYDPQINQKVFALNIMKNSYVHILRVDDKLINGSFINQIVKKI